MASITDLSYTDTLDNGKAPIKTDLTAMFDEFQTYINDSVKDNLVILTDFCAGSSPSYATIDALTFDLYNKQTVEDSDATGNYTLSTTGAWTDVDATNASIGITPELVGDFNAFFMFTVQSVTSNATNEVDVRFRLTDGSSTSTFTPRIKLVTGVTGTTNVIPVTIVGQFNDWSASAKTVKLQYFLSTLTATTLTLYANSNDPISMKVEKI
jgi:hypothetical protein